MVRWGRAARAQGGGVGAAAVAGLAPLPPARHGHGRQQMHLGQ